jgi:hypothetical protein
MRCSSSTTATSPQTRQSLWKREVTRWSMYHSLLYLERRYMRRLLSTFRARTDEGLRVRKDQYAKGAEEKGTGTVEMMQNRSKAQARGQARAMRVRRTGGTGTLCGCVTECMAGILSVRTERPHEAVPRRHGVEPACTNFAVGLAVIPRR